MDPTTPTNTTTPSNVDVTTAPRFVRAVYEMLQNEDQQILSWSTDGSHFQVYHVPRLEAEVLRKYFKHGKFSSLQRQLNNFGFHKWTKTRASVATFSHDVLVRCHLSQLDVLVSQMRLTQKTAKIVPVKKTPMSAKRPRSLHSTGPSTEHVADVKRHKLFPCEVCVVDDLSDVSFMSVLDSLWLTEENDNYGSSDAMLLLGVVDLVDLSALDWDATGASPLKAVALGCCDICSIMNSHVNISSGR